MSTSPAPFTLLSKPPSIPSPGSITHSRPSQSISTSSVIPPSSSPVSTPITGPGPSSGPEPGEIKADLQLVEALGGKDRLYVLRVADEMESLFLGASTPSGVARPPVSFNPSTSFHRRIVYQCAQYLGLLATSDGAGKPIVVRLPGDGSCLALTRRIIDIAPLAPPPAPSNVPPTGFKIMRRDPLNGTSSPMRGQSPAGESNEASRRNKTFEERQAEYEEARERIFSLSSAAGSSGRNSETPESSAGAPQTETGNSTEDKEGTGASKAVPIVPPRSRSSSTSSTESVPVIFSRPAFHPSIVQNPFRPLAPEFDPSNAFNPAVSSSSGTTTTTTSPSQMAVPIPDSTLDGAEYSSVVFPSVSSSSSSSVSNSRIPYSSASIPSDSASIRTGPSPSPSLSSFRPSSDYSSHSSASSSRSGYSNGPSAQSYRRGNSGGSNYRPSAHQPSYQPSYRPPVHQQTYPPTTASSQYRPPPQNQQHQHQQYQQHQHQQQTQLPPQGAYVAAHAFYQPPGGGQAYVFIPAVPYDTGQRPPHLHHSHSQPHQSQHQAILSQPQPQTSPFPPSGGKRQSFGGSAGSPSPYPGAQPYPSPPGNSVGGFVQSPMLMTNGSFSGYIATPSASSSSGSSSMDHAYQPQQQQHQSHNSFHSGDRTGTGPAHYQQGPPHPQDLSFGAQSHRFVYPSNPNGPLNPVPPAFTSANSGSSIYTQHRSSGSSVSSYNGDGGLSRPPSRGSTSSSRRLSTGTGNGGLGIRQGGWSGVSVGGAGGRGGWGDSPSSGSVSGSTREAFRRRESGNDRPSSPSSTISSASRMTASSHVASIPPPKDHPLPPRPDWSVGNQQFDLRRPDPILPSGSLSQLSSSDFPPLAGMSFARQPSDEPRENGGGAGGEKTGIWNGTTGRQVVMVGSKRLSHGNEVSREITSSITEKMTNPMESTSAGSGLSFHSIVPSSNVTSPDRSTGSHLSSLPTAQSSTSPNPESRTHRPLERMEGRQQLEPGKNTSDLGGDHAGVGADVADDDDDFQPRRPVMKSPAALYDPSSQPAGGSNSTFPGSITGGGGGNTGSSVIEVASIEAKLALINLGLSSSLKSATGADVLGPVVGPLPAGSGTNVGTAGSAGGEAGEGAGGGQRTLSYSSIVRRV